MCIRDRVYTVRYVGDENTEYMDGDLPWDSMVQDTGTVPMITVFIVWVGG